MLSRSSRCAPRARGPQWILAGIHGEEPAGPNAIAAAINDIAALGVEHPVVLIPLCNPHGYVRNWRYLNTPVYSTSIVGCASSPRLLLNSDDPTFRTNISNAPKISY